MKQLSYSINSWIFGNAPIDQIAACAKEIGADGIDVSGEPDELDAKMVKSALDRAGLKAFCINGNYLREDRALNHSDPDIRAGAVEYGKSLVDMAQTAGAPKVLLVPSTVNRGTFYESAEADWARAVESVREIAVYAGDRGIEIVLECVNKYEVRMVHTLEDGIRMAEGTGCVNVKIIADTFHMQLEEPLGIHNSLRHAGHMLGHLHVADNTRDVPGKGTFNWREILIALNDIGYKGAVSFEELPRGLGPADIFAGALTPGELVQELGFSLRYLKALEQTIGWGRIQ